MKDLFHRFDSVNASPCINIEQNCLQSEIYDSPLETYDIKIYIINFLVCHIII